MAPSQFGLLGRLLTLSARYFPSPAPAVMHEITTKEGGIDSVSERRCYNLATISNESAAHL